MPTPKQAFSQATYDKWRAAVPWTNEAIAVALDAEATDLETGGQSVWLASKYRNAAEYLRSGRPLSGAILRMVLGRLITVCTLCGKTALYRYGMQGRCREHRMEATPGFLQRNLMFNLRSAGLDGHKNLVDAKQRRLDAMKTLHVNRRLRSLRRKG